MQKTIFHIKEMDCPSEESLIRMKLEEIPDIARIDINIQDRKTTIFHRANTAEIEKLLSELKLGSSLVSSEVIEEELSGADGKKDRKQKKILWTVLFINFGFFIIEMVTGLISRSMGLVADSLDMLADAFMYAISLFAVGKAVGTKKRVAGAIGYFQILLAVSGLFEVARRFIFNESIPDFQFMIGISVLALAANGISLYILEKAKSNEAHIRASMICTSNDVIMNLGVIVGGILVFLLDSAIPDLVVGVVVFGIVIRGALRILKLAK
jgi:Co/Zn/Cd efflux system component